MEPNPHTTPERMRQVRRFDAVWARIENAWLIERVKQENEAAKQFDSSFVGDEIVPAQNERWPETPFEGSP